MSNVTSLAKAREAKRLQDTPKEVGKGFTLLHRKIQETEFYRKDSQAVHLWVHLIMSANYTDAAVKTEYGVIQLQRGQFITGRNTLAAETGIEPNRIQYLLKKFKKLGMIETASPGKFTVITISKYGEYQGEIVPEDSQKITRPKSGVARLPEAVVPEDSQKIPTANNITNKSLSNDNDMSSDNDESPRRKAGSIPYQAVLDAYNEAAGDRLPNAEKLNPKRRTAIKRLLGELKEPTVEAAGNYFHAFMSTAKPFYFGDNQSGWSASFDYLLRSDTLTKTREGSL